MRKLPKEIVSEFSDFNASQLKAEWARRDLIKDFTIAGRTYTQIEMMWIFKKLIKERKTK